MTEDEITTLVLRLSRSLRDLSNNEFRPETGGDAVTPVDIRKAIKEKSVICLEYGKAFKILTRRHPALHNLSPAGYREKWGFKKDTPLVCKSLQRDRRKKMKDMKLWEKRRRG